MGGDLTPAWPAMTPAERAQAYSPSTMVGGNIAPFLKAYEAQSAEAYAALGNVHTLAYGEKPSQTIDLALPNRTDTVPLHVFIHGGYWQELSRRESFFAAPDTVARGMAFAAVDYTLAPHATLDEIVAEVVAALEHLHDNATRFGIDPARIIVSGSSAGAQLAAMAGVTLEGAHRLAGLVLLSGIYDLCPLLDIYVNDALGMDMPQARRNSPVMRGLAGFPPSVIAWGAIETDEFKRQSRHFAQMLKAAGRDVTTLEVAGRNHFDIVHDLAHDAALGQQLARLAGV